MSRILRRQFASLFIIVFLTTMVLSVAHSAVAVAPPNIVSYQGRLLNASGVPIPDATISILFKLYDAPSAGAVLWSSTKTVSLTSGLFSENLGDATYTAIPTSVFANNDAVYLGVTVGADAEMTPLKRITAAPYALNSQTIDGIDSVSLVRTGATENFDLSSAKFLGASPLVFEGGTTDTITTTLAFTDPTISNKTITFQNASGTVALLSDIGGGSVFTTGTNGDYDNAAVIIGADLAETIGNASFSLASGNLFVTGSAGVEGMVYSDTGFGIGPSAELNWNTSAISDHLDLLFPESNGTTNGPALVIADASMSGFDWTGAPVMTEPRVVFVSDDGTRMSSLFTTDSAVFTIEASAHMETLLGVGGYLNLHTSGDTMLGGISGEDIALGAGDDIFLKSFGGSIYLNNDTNRPTNLNTGTSTGALTLGGGLGTVAIDSSDWDISTTGAITGVSFDANGSGNSVSNIDLSADMTGILPVANGGTNASSASITAFNNITGYTAAGATGTTSTNLVFSTSPNITTSLTTGSSSFDLLNTTATTINFGGGAITALNIGNDAVAYGGINIGSGAGTHTINIAGTGATSADTIRIGTGGGIDTISIGNDATDKTIAIGNASATNVSITDNNWSIDASGAANFTSVGAGTPGSGVFTDLSSNGTTTIGDSFADALNINSLYTTFSNLSNHILKVADKTGSDTNGKDLQIVGSAGFGARNGGAIDIFTGDKGSTGTYAGALTLDTGTGGGGIVYLGNTNATDIQIGSVSATAAISSTNWSVTSAGLVRMADDLAVNGSDITTTSPGTATIFNTNATTLSLGGAATTLNIGNGTPTTPTINIGSGATAHTINIAGIGATSADIINIGTGGTGLDLISIGSAATAWGIDATGAAHGITLATGPGAFTTLSSSGVTTIGNNSATVAIDSSSWNISTGGAMTSMGDLTMVENTAHVIKIADQSGVGAGSSLSILGEKGGAANVAGGDLSVVAGQGGTFTSSFSQNGGALNLTGGAGGAGVGGGGSGGQINITGGSQTGGNSAGDVVINAGSGANGDVTIGTTGTSTGIVTLGNSLGQTNIYSGESGVANWSIVSGLFTTTNDIAVNGGDITSSAATFNFLSSGVTTLNVGTFLSEIDIANGNGYSHTIKIGGNTDTNTIRIGSSAADGGNTSLDTVNIATGAGGADTITIGNSNASTLFTATGGDDWSISSAGLITTANDIAVNGGDLTTTSTTAALFNTTATTLFLGGAATTALNIGNGTSPYTAINIGSGATTHTINIAGTVASSADTINIGTAGADTINLGADTASSNVNINRVLTMASASSAEITTSATNGLTIDVADQVAGFGRSLALYGADGSTSGGGVFIAAGGGGSSSGGTISMSAGASTASGQTGGNLDLSAGAATTSGTGGTVYLAGGAAQTGANAHGGGLVLNGGNASQVAVVAGQIGGSVTIDGGSTFSTSAGAGGSVTINAGFGQTTKGDILIGQTYGTTVSMGGVATTLNLAAAGALTRTINIGTGTGADTINIGTGGTNADTINIGTGASANIVNLGSSTASSVVNVPLALTLTSATLPLITTSSSGTTMYVHPMDASSGAGAGLNIRGGKAASSSTGGGAVFAGGESGASGGNGGIISMTGGQSMAGNGNGGNALMYGGDGNGSGHGGGVLIDSGFGTAGYTVSIGLSNATAVSIGNASMANGVQVNLQTIAATQYAVCHVANGSGMDYLGDCSGAPTADFAEQYPTASGTVFGDIVIPGTKEVVTTNGDHIVQLVKSSGPYTGPVAGIVSNNTSDFTSAGYNVPTSENPMSIALVGRVPVNVTNENGPIAVGDFVTTSSTAGKGMKATQAGRVIGMALSSFNGVDGQVMVQVVNTWYFGNLIGTDGTSSMFTNNVITASVGNATAATPAFDSFGLALRGSAWDGNQAQTVTMLMKNVVTDTNNYRLSVRNTTDSEVAYVTNTGTMQVSGDMVVGGKLYPSDQGVVQKTKYIYYDGSSGPAGDYMRTNAKGWSTGSYDFAEMFPSSESLRPGEVVVFSNNSIEVKRSTKIDEKSIAGIVSTRPGFLAGDNTVGSYPIALAGRVPTNVNMDGGAISVGDPLTTSSKEGFAMKAKKAGPIVGYALEAFDGSHGNQITVFVNAGFWGGETTSQTPGTNNQASLFAQGGNETMTALNMSGNINMSGNDLLSIGRIAGLSDAWSIEFDGTIKTTTLLKTVITGHNNQQVETIAVTSPEAVITLAGTAKLESGSAEIRFADVSLDFGNVISAIMPIRVIATPNGPVSLYVSEKDQSHFVVKSFGATVSDIEFDWMVTAYRKGYEPVVAPAVVAAPVVSSPVSNTPSETSLNIPDTSGSSTPVPEVVIPVSVAPASPTSSDVTIVDQTVIVPESSNAQTPSP